MRVHSLWQPLKKGAAERNLLQTIFFVEKFYYNKKRLCFLYFILLLLFILQTYKKCSDTSVWMHSTYFHLAFQKVHQPLLLLILWKYSKFPTKLISHSNSLSLTDKQQIETLKYFFKSCRPWIIFCFHSYEDTTRNLLKIQNCINITVFCCCHFLLKLHRFWEGKKCNNENKESFYRLI